jgi:programmed cell death 6-interacting protein
MSSLRLAQTNSLQDQKERENLRTQYNATKVANHEPMTAPMPTRASQATHNTATTSTATTGGMWTPEMGIKFASVPAPASNAGNSNNVHNPAYPAPKKGGTWNAGAGLQFG